MPSLTRSSHALAEAMIACQVVVSTLSAGARVALAGRLKSAEQEYGEEQAD